MARGSGNMTTNLIGAALAIPISRFVNKKLAASWRSTTGSEPPAKLKDADVHWSEALMWAGLTAMSVVAVQRVAAAGAREIYRFTTGRHPD